MGKKYQILESNGEWADTHELMYSRFPEDKRRIMPTPAASTPAPGDKGGEEAAGKSAIQILNEHGIDLMKLNDDFNTQLLHAMERYAEQKNIINPPIESKDINKAAGSHAHDYEETTAATIKGEKTFWVGIHHKTVAFQSFLAGARWQQSLPAQSEQAGEKVTAEQYLDKQGYVKTVHPPKQEPIEPTFQRATVIRLMEEYAALWQAASQAPESQMGKSPCCNTTLHIEIRCDQCNGLISPSLIVAAPDTVQGQEDAENVIRDIDLELDFADFSDSQKINHINKIIRKYYKQDI